MSARSVVSRSASVGLVALVTACGSSEAIGTARVDASSPVDAARHVDVATHFDAVTREDAIAQTDSTVARDAGTDAVSDDAGSPESGAHDARSSTVDAHDAEVDAGGCPKGCPTGYTCGTANGLPVCRAPSGIPLFSHVFIIMEENTSLSTLVSSITANAAPSFAALRAKYASGAEYHGVTHPSLPNYIALTSGSPQGIGCDCAAQAGQGTCNALTCNLVLGSCTCSQSATNLADQLETGGKTWTAFGEGMGTPCNLVDNTNTNYAVRHVPFLYYDDIQTNASRCATHVVDYSSFTPATAPQFTYIAPNLIDDMHSPFPATQGNITSGDTWIAPVVAKITASSAYTDGGLFVIVWDEDDDSGGITGSNDPVPIFVLSPYAKSGGYMSMATMDHYSLLATIEDGLDLPRLGNAGVSRPSTADTLADYFPSN